MRLEDKKIPFLVLCLFIFVFFVSILNIDKDSLTMDEVAHLPAGYSYLTKRDMRLNPEHPPLVKDLAAIPLLFFKEIHFPQEIKDWKEDVNGQWGFGYNFLYFSGNDADKLIFWGRIPMIFILLLTGLFIFKISKEFFSPKVALFALFFFSFSPTFLAHGRLVTTDVPAAFGVLFSTYYFLRALKDSKWWNIVISGFAFGISQLLKFSLILLVPYFIFLGILWHFFVARDARRSFSILFFTFLIGFSLVWVVYIYHTIQYPPERQLRDTKFILTSYSGGPSSIKESCFSFSSVQKLLRCPAEITIFMSDKPILRALAHYLLGLLMIFQRAAGGHTTFFLGEVSAAGWKEYFPVVYAIKEPLALHIFTIIALSFFTLKIKEPIWKRFSERARRFIKENFIPLSLFIFVVLYWFTSINANLNIGVRHLLPSFPFTFILVSKAIVDIIHESEGRKKRIIQVMFLILFLWQAISVLKIYPHFLSYANEIVGGPQNLHIYTVDSNLDWGQDLKRLKKWMEKNKIERIYLDYFGGAHPQYYLKDKFLPWNGRRDPKELPRPSYLGVSLTFLQGGRGIGGVGFDQPTGYYLWLERYQPIARIGYSIFVYFIE